MFKAIFTASSIFALSFLGSSLLGGCSGEADHSKMRHNVEAAAAMNGVEVSSAYVVPPFAGRTTSAGYFTLHNKGADTRLIIASSPIAARVEIHTHISQDGIMKMRRLDYLDIKSGTTAQFEPGGLHLMMFGSTLAADILDHDEAVEVPLTLAYQDGTEVTIMAIVKDRAAPMMDHSSKKHSGH